MRDDDDRLAPARGIFNGLKYGCLLWVFIGVAASVLLSGCATTGAPPPCHTCIGPYDIGLTSHREALGLEND